MANMPDMLSSNMQSGGTVVWGAKVIRQQVNNSVITSFLSCVNRKTYFLLVSGDLSVRVISDLL